MNDEFLKYWSSLTSEDKSKLADKARTSVGYLSQVANGHRNAGGSLCARLKQADTNITDLMLRPDLYAA